MYIYHYIVHIVIAYRRATDGRPYGVTSLTAETIMRTKGKNNTVGACSARLAAVEIQTAETIIRKDAKSYVILNAVKNLRRWFYIGSQISAEILRITLSAWLRMTIFRYCVLSLPRTSLKVMSF